MRANTTPRPDARTAYATPQTDGKRIAWVDCAKALAIIGVMLVHTAIPDAAKHAIYVALIPLFFYLAGLFADVHKDLTPEVYLQRQWRRLLLPYFSFGLLHYVLWWTVGRHFGADAGTTVAAWQPLWGIVWGNADSLTQYVPLWFLPCLFSTETLYYIGVRPALTRRARLLRMAALALLGASLSTLEVELPWGLTAALVMIFFYGLGALTRDAALRPTWPRRQASGLILIALGGYLLAWWGNPTVAVHQTRFGSFALFLLGGTGGIILTLAVARSLAHWPVAANPLTFIGRYTLLLLATHLTLFSIIKGITVFLLHRPLTLYDSTVASLGLVAAALMLSVPLILLVRRFMPALAGLKHRSNR